jgi:glycosyltransferase involved in cell wall biosynthesis
MQPITLAITTFCRFSLTIKSFEKVIDDPRINDIVIVDDASPDDSGRMLSDYFDGNDKVRVIIQPVNRSMQLNKADAVALSKNEWLILLDSDNEISVDYIDALEREYEVNGFKEDTIYAPVRALPTFIYNEFEGETIDRHNVKDFVKKGFFGAIINTSNYFIHRDTFTSNYKFQPEIKGVDTAAHFLRHLQNDGKFHVVKGLEYLHAISDDSEFMKEVNYNMGCAMAIEKKLLEL